MTVLARDLHKGLEKTVKQARRVAEAGARQAVQQLRVGDGDAPKDLIAASRAAYKGDYMLMGDEIARGGIGFRFLNIGICVASIVLDAAPT